MQGAISPPRPRSYGAVNWIGLQTLLGREVMRFVKVSAQTLAAPVMSTLLFMAVFVLAMGARSGPHGTAYPDFLAPGLMMMGVITNAFQNTSSSFIGAKVQGNAVDFLIPPLSALELTIAFIGGGIVRGLAVGTASALAAAPFAHVMPIDWLAVLFFSVTGAVIFAAVGLLGGIWAEKFDHLAAFTNFIITPLTFLSGTFYSVERLPEPIRSISHWNPVFFLIDGFRAGFIGHADTSLWVSGAISGALAAALCFTCWSLLKSGWRLKA